MKKDNWKLIDEYNIKNYACGLIPGDKVMLHTDLKILDWTKKLVLRTINAGTYATVLSGASESPDTVWCKWSTGERFTWSDDQTIFEYFKKA